MNSEQRRELYATVTENYKLREFKEHDWDGYAGAENFDSGQAPFRGSCRNGEMDVVVDKSGISFVYDDEYDDIREFAIQTKSFEQSMLILNSFNHEKIDPVIFECLDR